METNVCHWLIFEAGTLHAYKSSNQSPSTSPLSAFAVVAEAGSGLRSVQESEDVMSELKLTNVLGYVLAVSVTLPLTAFVVTVVRNMF